jgi:PAS domain S-box-containing protein
MHNRILNHDFPAQLELIDQNNNLLREMDELKRAYAELKILFEEIDEVLFSVDMVSYKLIQISSACEKIYGYSTAEFLSDKDLWEKVIHPGDKNILIPQIELLRQGKKVSNQYRIIHRDSSIRWIENKIIPTLDDAGALIRLDGITTDITERKRGEEIILISEVALELKNKELELKNKELEQFAYVASHDLQEPVRTTSSFAHLLQRQYEGLLDERADKYLTFIIQSSERMKALINDLLDYSRIGRKREKENVNCNIILQEVLDDLGAALRETTAKISIGPLPVFRGYPIEIKQLFQNLIINAIKFRKQDIVPEIKIASLRMKDRWEITCTDNGIGINKEHQERIFVIFQRLHTRNEYKGSGIGLAHCKKIVEMHEGKIWVESDLGEGSSFHFTIHG